jgi:predicted Zn-dependent protease
MSETPLVALSPPPDIAPARSHRLARLVRWLNHQRRRPGRLLGYGVLLVVVATAMGAIGVQAWAYLHLRAGRANLLRHHNAEALKHFESCRRFWPDDPTALLLSARASWRLHDFEQANLYLRDYQRAAGSTDDYTRESFLLMAAQGDTDKAEKYCRRLLDQNDPATAHILEALVAGCMRQYRFSEGLVYLQQWLDLEPDDMQALLFQISIDHLRQAPDDAIARYQRVLQLDPDHDGARFRFASTLVENRRYHDAMPHLEMLRQRQPKNMHVLVLLAQCRDFLGEQAEAERLLDVVLTEAPHDPVALAERGRLALRDGDLDAAETWLRHALSHAPGDFQAHYNLGQCFLQQGRTSEVARQQQRLIQLESDQKRLRQIMTQDMSQRPHDAVLHHEVAKILLRRGDLDGGVRWLQSGLREDPTSVALHQTLAEYYQQGGSRERAAYHRQFVPPDTSRAGP